ncbi:hypothetical protein B484DRAFT_406427 [Ochromonadaceae sp. CCMP2298]|nr:hypothetical protein B484DRAFT_406427 [Ochromonadaceae sp. CCMP2298]
MGKGRFMAAVASSISPGSLCDPFDRDMLYFLLFGKAPPSIKAALRAARSLDEVCHTSPEESAASGRRRAWLSSRIPLIVPSSELFFSQLRGSDLSMYAERFWDNTVQAMAVECADFPAAVLGWQVYREIVLVGVQSYIIKGSMEITPKGGEPVLVQAGDFVTFPDGFACNWFVKETILKHYYIY